jgi:hypothetical protein
MPVIVGAVLCLSGLALIFLSWCLWSNDMARQRRRAEAAAVAAYELAVQLAVQRLGDQMLRDQEAVMRGGTAAQLATLRAQEAQERNYEQLLEDMYALTVARPAVYHCSAEASERARKWLVRHLSPAQAKDFGTNGGFNVRGGTSKIPYRITYGCSMNIVILDVMGRPTPRRLCFGPHAVPTFDIMLAQKWALESNEVEAMRVAHRHSGPLTQRAQTFDF